MNQFERLSVRLDPAVTRNDVARVLRAVLSEPEPWKWFARARIPFPYAVAVLRGLRDEQLVRFDPLELTDSGTELVEELGVYRTLNMSCPCCGGSGTGWSELEQVYADYLEIQHARPREENPEYDQGAMTGESLFRRLALMIGEGDVTGREVIALGDDDLASIALALTGLPLSVTVLEIDPRICEYIETIARERKLPVRVYRQDLAANLPVPLLGRFDTFVCDPPETGEGLLLFVEKGLALLKPGDGHAGYFGATVLEASLGKWKRWQTAILRHPVAFTHILPPFTEYETWADERPLPDLPPLAQLSENPWYRFAFYRIESLPEFEPAEDFDVANARQFYFDRESYYEAFKSPAARRAWGPATEADQPGRKKKASARIR